MSAPLPALRLAEVQAKLRSLDEELLHWKTLTEQENLGLRRHHLQVARLDTVLQTLTAPVRTALQTAHDDATILQSVEAWENQILAAHSIWEVFRSKLVLREDALFRDVLSACDDLLWSCYAPAMAHFAPDRKAPPLVYFTATWSPFAMARDSSFQNEVRAGASSAAILSDDEFLAVLRKLPVPLVSLPWYQGFHLPGALVLAHEAGHIVESDFALSPHIAAALQRASLSNTALWTRWSSEVFADIYGCVMMGPAFVASLMNLFAIAPASVQNEVRNSGKYPTRALRVELALAALHHLGHSVAAQRLRLAWESTYGAMSTMTELLPDVEKVVAALLAGPYDEIGLTNLNPFPAGSASDIGKIGDAALDNYPPGLREYNDVRLLFAGAQYAHENAAGRNTVDAYRLIVAQAITRGANEYRMRGQLVAKSEIQTGIEQARSLDEQTGRDLFQRLF